MKGKVEYLVKWKDYPDSDNSWIGIDDLNCPLLVKKFESNESRNWEEEIDSIEYMSEDEQSNGKNVRNIRIHVKWYYFII